MADIAASFGWPLSELNELPLDELRRWHVLAKQHLLAQPRLLAEQLLALKRGP